MIAKKSRILLLIICLTLTAVYFLPVWDISLEAPQYPEGLGFQIWLGKMSGDLNTVNGLNHYIGMKKIEPDSMSELKIMPFILGVLILSGIAVSLVGKKKFLYAWIIFFILLGVAGGVDFWKWEYEYGHDLNPTAAIKVPGMTYQPPLIGTKTLLNFTAHSYPAEGGIILIAGGIISVIVGAYEFKKSKKHI
ncbi:MAG TPA: hypothetical protein VN514_10845 [Ignavibacteria bacterium]|nr:hypothetical protein [Ignavibacteria bacterium]